MASSASPLALEDDIRSDRACFDGMVLAALAFGALVMLYIQLTQVLLRRPKRGRIYWFIVVYSTILFPLSTLAFIGRFKLAELTYVTHRNFSSGPKGYYVASTGMWPNVMERVSSTVIPWVGDLLMLYRLMVLWNYQWLLLIIPSCLHLARIGLSIPVLISHTRTTLDLSPRSMRHALAFYSTSMALNVIITFLICLRLFMMRHRAERVLGKLQATLYNSAITMFVESGGLFTIWSVVYLITRVRDSWVQDVFSQPYTYILALTRMLIILRMAQDRAWTKDIVTATDTGVLDWQVSSTNSTSIALRNVPNAMCQDDQQKLPRKFREDSISSKSVIHYTAA